MRIGGDIGGLRSVGASLTGVVGSVQDTAEYLSKRVNQLVTDAGWTGDAAEEFKGAWKQDATAVLELSSCTKLAGACLDQLADSLDAAQHRLDHAVAAAKADGLPFAADGYPIDGPYSGHTAAAATQLTIDANAALTAAQDARDTAVEELHDIAAAMSGEDTSFVKAADAAALAAALKGYYALPNEMSETAKNDLAAFNRKYQDTRYQRKHTAGTAAKKELTDQLKQMRAERKLLQTDADVAEKIADHFKGGRLLGSSIGDIADGLGVLQDGGKLPAWPTVPGRRRGARRLRDMGPGEGGSREGLVVDARDPCRRRIERGRDHGGYRDRCHPVRRSVSRSGGELRRRSWT